LAAAWAASELLIVAGAFVGYSLHGDKMLLVLLWVLPGMGVGVWGNGALRAVAREKFREVWCRSSATIPERSPTLSLLLGMAA